MSAKFGHRVNQLAGCAMLGHRLHSDVRGMFSKVLSGDSFESRDNEFSIRELFWSRSQRGGIRGMHVQVPPHAASKLIWVSQGLIQDIILDLRVDSKTFGGYLVTELSENSGAIIIPEGCAHGFEVLSDDAVVNYAQDKSHNPSHDKGVAWNSFGFNWKASNPILSDRDRALPQMSEFQSPFMMPDAS